MNGDELNPNHPVTRMGHDQWHKLCALALFKSGNREMEITPADIDAMNASDAANIVLDCRNNRMVLRLVSRAEGERLARAEGGLPV